MTNEYFTHSTDIIPYTKAKDTDVDTPLGNIEAGFDKLVAPHATKKGFGDPVPVGDPTDIDHAVTSLAVQNNTLTYFSDTGSVDAFNVAASPAPTGYATGQIFWCKAANTVTGASTFEVNSLGAKSFKKQDGEELLYGDIVAGSIFGAVYTGSYFQVIAATLPTADESAGNSATAAATSAAAALVSADAAAVSQELTENALKRAGVL